MTGSELKTQVTNILGGRDMGDSFFYQLLNISKTKFEDLRPWMILRQEDSSQTAKPSDDYTTMKDLPSDFAMFAYNRPIVLKSSDDSVQTRRQVPFNKRHQHRNSSNFFYADYANNQFALTGNVDKTYTIHVYHSTYSPDINEDSEWVFPSRYHGILAFDVAVMQKLGVDYDETNARQADGNALVVDEMLRQMTKWDDKLQRSELGV